MYDLKRLAEELKNVTLKQVEEMLKILEQKRKQSRNEE